jgi:hypothetical protein
VSAPHPGGEGLPKTTPPCGPVGRKVVLTVEEMAGGQLRLEASVPFEVLPPPTPVLPPWRYLSRPTLRVARLLCERPGWLTREEIARELSEAPEGDLRPLLADLARRGVLESSPKRGYALALPADRPPDAFRGWLLTWLDAEEKTFPPDG